MKYYRTVFTLCLIAFIYVPCLQAQYDANMLLKEVSATMQKANDYSVKAHIRVDMPFIRILPVDVKIFFKQPDKFKVESESIAVVPRRGFEQIPRTLEDFRTFTSLIQGEERIDSVLASIVTVIPLSDTSDLVLGKFWIDPERHVVLKSQLTTRSSGTIVTEYTYGIQVAYGLPDRMVFSVDVGKFKLPKNLPEDNHQTPDEKEKETKDKKGKIYITLTDYQVNKGIPDAVFK
jgi:hypothetical protein